MSEDIEVPDEDDEDMETHSDGEMVIVGRAAFIKAQQEAHDRIHAHAQELRASIDRMMDELNPEHTYTMFTLMQHLATSGDAAFPHYLSGQLSAYLRLKHKACLTCGTTAHETTMHGI
jgi:hypothetical protein